MRERGFAQSRASIVGLRIIFSASVRITAFHRHGFGSPCCRRLHSCSVQRRTFVFDTDEHWGKCYYQSRVEDGLVVPIVPSNTPQDLARLAVDPAAHEFRTCMNSNCKLCLRAKQAAKTAKKQKKTDRSGAA